MKKIMVENGVRFEKKISAEKNVISDKELYKKCVMYGKQALQARRKFMGLLPEVARRQLFELRGFSSIYEFAARLAGLSREQVGGVLRLEKRLVAMPVLHEALVNGVVSANKLIRVASIVTAANQQEILQKVENLSSRALEVFVSDAKRGVVASEDGADAPAKTVLDADGFLKPKIEQKSLHVQTLVLDEDVEKSLLDMQKKGIDVNSFLREAIAERGQRILSEKENLAVEENYKCEERAQTGAAASRHVPVRIMKVVKAEFGVKCAVAGCVKRAEQLHHVRRFAIYGSHDPRFLKPLCRGHHELAHVT